MHCMHIKIIIYRSHCHGSVHINDDSKSHSSIPIAWCVILNLVDVLCGQSACDNEAHIRIHCRQSAHDDIIMLCYVLSYTQFPGKQHSCFGSITAF